MFHNIFKDDFEFKTNQTKNTEHRKKSFLNEYVENADLYKTVMN